MEQAAGRDAAGGRHQAAGTLPARPAAGAEQARGHLEYRGTHRAAGTGPGWITDRAVLARVRDALRAGGRP
ncbi:MAG: hypothetical protein ACRDPD_35155 [Streptosporangiaceae bacterium]